MVKIAKCCCCSLRTWTLVISSLGLVFCILDSAFFILDKDISEKYRYRNINIVEKDSDEDDSAENVSKENESPYFPNIVIINFIFSLIGVIINAITLYGALKSKRYLLIPWLFIVLLLLCMYEIILYSDDFEAFDYSFTLFRTGFLLLMWLIVYCFYQNIKEEEFLSMQRRLRVQTQHIQLNPHIGSSLPEQV